MTRDEYLQKLAYEFGCRAAEQGMDKEAFLGLGIKALGKGLQTTWGLGKGMLSNMGKGLTGSVGDFGVGVAKQFQKAAPRAYEWSRVAGRGVPREALGFGLLGGVLNSAMADPGERMKAFGTGFAGGALGGAAWRGAGNVIRHGQAKAYKAMHGGRLFPAGSRTPYVRDAAGKVLEGPAGGGQFQAGKGLYSGAGSKVFKPQSAVADTAKAHTEAGKSWFTNPNRWYNRANEGAMKRIGSKAVVGALPLAGAVAASSYTPTFEGESGGAQGAQQGAAANPYNNPYYQQGA